MGIEDNPWLAWQFDNAVSWFGVYVENRLSERGSDGKPLYEIEYLLGLPRKLKTLNVASLSKAVGEL